ncbi:Protein RALF-like [Actinidia chinensis var. chinensis]|uniref:Protein RALF-like n=1 Tax=Actinidia chinensis var. chinensis TaxID=1590841 RepID=A0A2R6QXY9_ACTCC|nr:Protein RALF-like [Actinidia chinensis var. chinensis]
MALSSFQIPIMLLFTLLIYATSNSWVRAQIDHSSLHLMTEALEWQPKTSIQDEFGIIDDDLDNDIGFDRRYLHEIRKRFISYEALRKNNVPCEKSGLSYYSCSVRGRANPYSRGCSFITHCGRYTRR